MRVRVDPGLTNSMQTLQTGDPLEGNYAHLVNTRPVHGTPRCTFSEGRAPSQGPNRTAKRSHVTKVSRVGRHVGRVRGVLSCESCFLFRFWFTSSPIKPSLKCLPLPAPSYNQLTPPCATQHSQQQKDNCSGYKQEGCRQVRPDSAGINTNQRGDRTKYEWWWRFLSNENTVSQK